MLQLQDYEHFKTHFYKSKVIVEEFYCDVDFGT